MKHQIWYTHDSEGIPKFGRYQQRNYRVGRNMIASFRAGAGSFYGMDSMQVPGVPTNSQVRRVAGGNLVVVKEGFLWRNWVVFL